MAESQVDILQTNLLQAVLSDYVYKDVMIQKMDRFEQQVSDIENRLKKAEQKNDFLWEMQTSAETFLTFDGRQKRGQLKKKQAEMPQDDWQDCRKMICRALEILTEWEEAEDIKIQIQYAAIIVGKIAKLKEKDVIRADDTRKKICTLLRNAIRLNASEEMLSREQIALIKEGFSFIGAENIQKEDLLQLNRKLRKKGLATMPAWE